MIPQGTVSMSYGKFTLSYLTSFPHRDEEPGVGCKVMALVALGSVVGDF